MKLPLARQLLDEIRGDPDFSGIGDEDRKFIEALAVDLAPGGKYEKEANDNAGKAVEEIVGSRVRKAMPGGPVDANISDETATELSNRSYGILSPGQSQAYLRSELLRQNKLHASGEDAAFVRDLPENEREQWVQSAIKYAEWRQTGTGDNRGIVGTAASALWRGVVEPVKMVGDAIGDFVRGDKRVVGMARFNPGKPPTPEEIVRAKQRDVENINALLHEAHPLVTGKGLGADLERVTYGLVELLPTIALSGGVGAVTKGTATKLGFSLARAGGMANIAANATFVLPIAAAGRKTLIEHGVNEDTANVMSLGMGVVNTAIFSSIPMLRFGATPERLAAATAAAKTSAAAWWKLKAQTMAVDIAKNGAGLVASDAVDVTVKALANELGLSKAQQFDIAREALDKLEHLPQGIAGLAMLEVAKAAPSAIARLTQRLAPPVIPGAAGTPTDPIQREPLPGSPEWHAARSVEAVPAPEPAPAEVAPVLEATPPVEPSPVPPARRIGLKEPVSEARPETPNEPAASVPVEPRPEPPPPQPVVEPAKSAKAERAAVKEAEKAAEDAGLAAARAAAEEAAKAFPSAPAPDTPVQPPPARKEIPPPVRESFSAKPDDPVAEKIAAISSVDRVPEPTAKLDEHVKQAEVEAAQASVESAAAEARVKAVVEANTRAGKMSREDRVAAAKAADAAREAARIADAAAKESEIAAARARRRAEREKKLAEAQAVKPEDRPAAQRAVIEAALPQIAAELEAAATKKPRAPRKRKPAEATPDEQAGLDAAKAAAEKAAAEFPSVQHFMDIPGVNTTDLVHDAVKSFVKDLRHYVIEPVSHVAHTVNDAIGPGAMQTQLERMGVSSKVAKRWSVATWLADPTAWVTHIPFGTAIASNVLKVANWWRGNPEIVKEEFTAAGTVDIEAIASQKRAQFLADLRKASDGIEPSEVYDRLKEAGLDRNTAAALATAAVAKPGHAEQMLDAAARSYMQPRLGKLSSHSTRPELDGDSVQYAGANAAMPLSPQAMIDLNKPVSAVQVVDLIGKLFNFPVQQGIGISIKGAAGRFLRQHGVAQVKEWGDIPVAAHELAHHLEKQGILNGMPQHVAAEVARLDYNPAAARPSEGFAEYLRYSLTGVRQPVATPAFDAWWNVAVLANPKLGERLATVAEMAGQYRDQGSVLRAQAALRPLGQGPDKADKTLFERIKQKGDYAKTLAINHLFDSLYRIAQYEAPAMKGLGRSAHSAHVLALYVQGTRGMRAIDAVSGTGVRHIGSGETLEVRSPALRDILNQAPTGAWDKSGPEKMDVGTYWHSLHAAELYAERLFSGKQEFDPGMSHADALRNIQLVHADPALRASWESHIRQLIGFADSLIDVSETAGTLRPGEAQAIKTRYQWYMPLYREQIARDTGHYFGEKRSEFGSSAQVANPIESLVLKARLAYEAAEQQVVKDSIIEKSYQGAKAGDVVPIDPTPENLARGPVWRRIENGKWQHYLIEQELHDAVTKKGYAALSMPGPIGKFLGMFAETTRAGATGFNLPFMLVNFPVDLMTANFQSTNQVGFAERVKMLTNAVRNVVHQVGLVGGMKKSTMDEWFDVHGGSFGTRLGAGNAEARATANDLKLFKDVPTFDKAKRVGNAVLDKLAGIVNSTEVAVRKTEFEAALRNRGFDPRSEASMRQVTLETMAEVMKETADVTTNFKRGGKTTMALNRVIPFFNVGFGGPRDAFLAARRNPWARAVEFSVLAGLTAAYWLTTKDDKSRQEWSPQARYGYFTLTAPDGTPLLRLRRPRDQAWLFSASIEAMLDTVYKEDPRAAMQWAKGFSQSMPVDVLNPIANVGGIGPLVDALRNHDSWRDMPIDNEGDMNMRASARGDEYSSAQAKAIGEQFNWSPKRVDFFLDRVSGGQWAMLRDLTGGRQSALGAFATRGFTFRGDPAHESMNTFYETRKNADEDLATAKDSDKDTPQQRERGWRMAAYSDLMKSLREVKKQELGSGGASFDEQFAYTKWMTGLARHAMAHDESPKDWEPLDRYPNPLTATDLPDNLRAPVMEWIGKLSDAASDPRPQRKIGEPLVKWQEREAEWKERTAWAKGMLADVPSSRRREALRERLRKDGLTAGEMNKLASVR